MEQLAQVQSYLVGNIHHQVVAFVSVAVLKGSNGRVSVKGKKQTGATGRDQKHSHICSCCLCRPLCVSWGRGCNLKSCGASRWLPAGCRTATPSYSAQRMQPDHISLQLAAIFVKQLCRRSLNCTIKLQLQQELTERSV